MSALRQPQPAALAPLPASIPSPEQRPRRHLVAVPPLDAPPPDPASSYVAALAAQAFEVVEGVRGIAQLGAAISVGVARTLMMQRALLHERRCIYKDHRGTVVRVGGVQLCRVQPRITEAAAVVHTEQRSHAVALRLEWVHSRWRACELQVL